MSLCECIRMGTTLLRFVSTLIESCHVICVAFCNLANTLDAIKIRSLLQCRRRVALVIV